MNNEKIKSKLKGVPETMLITLRAKYLETKKQNGIINDPKTIEILDQIEYDFAGKKEVSKPSQMGVCLRTDTLDEITKKFILKNPKATIINLGCGLDTRFNRLDNGEITWFDLDVPEAIELRKHFFKEVEKYKFISKSVHDFSWARQIPTCEPILFISEGVLMYFTEKQVKSIFKTIKDNFPGSQMVFDVIHPFAAKNSKRHPDVKKYNAPFKWGIKTGKELENWDIGIKLINEYYFMARHKDKQPFTLKLLALIPFFRKMSRVVHIRF